jgi:hypothetical protein
MISSDRDDVTEVDFMDDASAYYAYEVFRYQENIKTPVYVIACKGISSGRTMYLQKLSMGDYWTQFIYNARSFLSKDDSKNC